MGAMSEVYTVEYTLKLLGSDASPEKRRPLRVAADDFEEAGKKASPELIKIGFGAGMYDVWDATIVKPSGERREILRGGGWLIDIATGQQTTIDDKVKNK